MDKPVKASSVFSDNGYDLKKYISLVLVICMLCGATLTANAASLYACSLGIGSESNGVGLSYTTKFSARASEIGVKDIVLYEKINGVWYSYSIPSVSDTNSTLYAGGGTYTNAVKGRTYKATCTHYAVYNGVTYTLTSSTNEFVYN